MPILFILLMNYVVCAGACLIAFRFFEFKSLSDSLITAFILYAAQIVLTELILGVAGILRLGNLIALNLCLFLLIWYAARKKKERPISICPGEIPRDRLLIFSLALLCGFITVKFCINLVNPPFGWDNLNYHFTFAVEWLKHANLKTPITVFDDPSPTYYPVNASLIFLWFIMPLKNVFLADLAQFPFFALAFLSVFSIGRKIGLTRGMALSAATLFTLTPNYFKQTEVAYVDVMVAGLFLACLNYLFLLDRDKGIKPVLAFGAGLGLLLGTKTVALPYSLLLLMPFLFSWMRAKRPLYHALACFTLAAAIGGYAYVRNLLDTGNPLYPLDVSVFGKEVFKGAMDISVYKAHFKASDYSLSKLLFHEGFGVQSVLIVVPAALLCLPALLLKKRNNAQPLIAYLSALPLLGYLAYHYCIPLPNSRYLYPFLGAGILSGFYFLRLLNIPERIIDIASLVLCIASVAEVAKRAELAASLILSVLFFFSLTMLLRYLPTLRLDSLKAPFLLLVVAALLACPLNSTYERNEFNNYVLMEGYSGFWPDATRAWQWLNQHTRGENIAYAGRPVPFPLYGSGLKNNVFYVSVNSTEPALLHYFPSGRYRWGFDFSGEHREFEREGNYRSKADYATWLRNLRAKDTDILFVYSLHQTKDVEFPMEDRWAREHPDEFSEVFANETIHIYRILSWN